jgi:hypothetical protein
MTWSAAKLKRGCEPKADFNHRTGKDLTMPWERERNIRSLSPHGLKAAEGHAAPGGVHDINSVPCPEMGPGLLSMTPIGAGKSSPYMPASARPSVGKPRD